MNHEGRQLVAVVTGGTRGIGLGIAESLIRKGANVAIIYRENEDAAVNAKCYLESLLNSNQKIIILKGDASNSSTVMQHYQEIADRLGIVNVLVNNAGIMPRQSFAETSFSDWDRVISINLNSAFYWISVVIPGMKAVKYGRIVNISSIAARIGGMVGPHYAASKAGLLGLTKYSARELGKFGITVNAIAPAFIMDSGLFANWTNEDKLTLKDKILVPELGTVRDVVSAFEYLLASAFVTGATLDVNGGAFMTT